MQGINVATMPVNLAAGIRPDAVAIASDLTCRSVVLAAIRAGDDAPA